MNCLLNTSSIKSPATTWGGAADVAQPSDASERLTANPVRLAVVLPTYNDWESVTALLPRIDSVAEQSGMAVDVLVVDDGSQESPEAGAILHLQFSAIRSIRVIELTHNLGNQRAIASGISYVADNLPCDYLVVMDSDHQDDPEYIPQLIEASMSHGGKLVFAERSKRSEGPVFRFFYLLYRVLFRLLTGSPISVGNFSVIPARAIARVASISGLWSHYPSSVMKAGLQGKTISSHRKPRHAGKSSMRFASLIVHGFASFVVQADLVVARIFVALLVLTAVIVVGALATFVFTIFGDLIVPRWALQILGFLLILFFQAIMMIFMLLFIVLATRNQPSIISSRDYPAFILTEKEIFPVDEAAAQVAK